MARGTAGEAGECVRRETGGGERARGGVGALELWGRRRQWYGSGAQLSGQAEWSTWDSMKSSSGAESGWLAASVAVCPRDSSSGELRGNLRGVPPAQSHGSFASGAAVVVRASSEARVATDHRVDGQK